MQAGRSRADHGATAGLKPRRPRRERWTRLASLAVLVAGMAGSALGASAWGSSVRNDGQRKFSAAADNVGSSLKTLLERDGDLVATARTLISTSPGVTDEQFRQWFATMGAARRYPGLFGFGGIASVPATDPGAASVLALDSSAGSVTFVPGQPRPAYCFITLVVMLDSGDTLAVPGSTVGRLLGLAPKNLDVCQGPLGAPLNDQQQTGQPGVISFASLLPGGVSLGVGGIGGVGAAGGVGGTGASSASSQADAAPAIFLSPVYRGVPSAAATPDTSGPFWGWVGAMFDVNTILRTARGGDGHTSVVLSRQQGAAAPVEVGRVGTAPRRGRLTRTVDIDADGRWIAQLSGSLATGGLSASAQSAAVLAAGFAVSVLLYSLIVVLGRSRERALVLVERKTGELQHQALHDALTGLPNRALVLDRAEQMLVRAQRELVPVAALFVDLDGFKDINDSFGHGAGDELLQLVATRLRTAVRAADTVGRLGGDEFVVLAEGASLAAGPELVAERVLEALKEPFRTDATGGNPLVVSASIGIAGGIRSSADELLRDADIALYRAKAAGKSCFVVFEPEMQEAIQTRLELEMDLRVAVETSQFFLEYQPIFDLKRVVVTGVEALLRWQHPTKGVIAPMDFIPLIEESGAIVPVGRWVLHESCRQAEAWHRRGHRINVSVNVSARQAESDGLVKDVRSALAQSGLEPSALIIEITETTLMRDTEKIIAQLSVLKAIGVRVAIDDFGTGYSSLAYLQQFPVDSLKIDRSFISGMGDNADGSALIHTLVQLGKDLGLETVAEGIEDDLQLSRLQIEDCDTGQGFLFARPLPAEDVEHFLLTFQHPSIPSLPSSTGSV